MAVGQLFYPPCVNTEFSNGPETWLCGPPTGFTPTSEDTTDRKLLTELNQNVLSCCTLSLNQHQGMPIISLLFIKHSYKFTIYVWMLNLSVCHIPKHKTRTSYCDSESGALLLKRQYQPVKTQMSRPLQPSVNVLLVDNRWTSVDTSVWLINMSNPLPFWEKTAKLGLKKGNVH